MPLITGTRLGIYEIVAPLGAGGMGEVYRATDTKLGREVALKVLPAAFAQDAERMARFTREAHVLASLNHPNIAAIYGIEQNALVMELVEGEILRGPLALDTALTYARQIAEAMEYAHEKGIIHRDLKPANVMITPEGVVKVLDFGLAKVADARLSTADATLTMRPTEAGLIMGTASYMSPEQAAGKTTDKRSDIWSFGVVLWEMLSGRMLFRGETVSETMADVMRAEIRFDSLTETPEAIRNLLRRCLVRDVKNRMRDIGEARLAIVAFLANPQEVEAAPSRSWRRFVWPGVAAALALATAGLLYFREQPKAASVARFEIHPPEKGSFTGRSALSPDGRMIAFAAARPDGQSFLWVRPLDALEARPLPGTEGAGTSISWSPDSRSLTFSGAGIRKLTRVDVAGGPPQALCDALAGPPVPAWSHTGVVVFKSASGLAQVSAAGGACTPVTIVDAKRGELFHTAPVSLPDGRHFVYLRGGSQPGDRGVYVGSLDTTPEKQDPKRLLAADSGAIYAPAAHDSRMGYLLFLRGNVLMAQLFDPSRLVLAGDAVPVAERVGNDYDLPNASVSDNGSLAYRSGNSREATQITWFDRAGKALGSIVKPGDYDTLALSPDGRRVAFERYEGTSGDIWLHEFERGTTSRLTVDPSTDWIPVWFPNNARLFFASRRDGGQSIYQKDADNMGGERVVLKAGGFSYPTDVSPDGRFLLYAVADPGRRLDLRVLPLDGNAGVEAAGKPFLETVFSEGQAKFSTDGRYVAYTSDATGRNEIYVRAFSADGAASGQWMVSSGGGNQPRWSRDGKELWYISADSKLMTVPVSTNPAFRPGAATALFPVPILGSTSSSFVHRWDAAPDGKRFLFTVTVGESVSAPIVVVQNWQAELKKK